MSGLAVVTCMDARIDVEDVVHTAVDGDSLRIRSWHRGRGLQERRRS